MEDKVLLDIEKTRGEVIRVEVSEFKGKKLLNIRTWYTNDAGELAPTKKGVTLSYEQFQKFQTILPQIEELLRA